MGAVLRSHVTYSWSSSLTNADEYFADSLPKRKGARADEWNGLENRQGCKLLGGSNPPPSATKFLLNSTTSAKELLKVERQTLM